MVKPLKPKVAPPAAAEAAPRLAFAPQDRGSTASNPGALTMGLRVAQVARVQHLTVRRVRQIIAETLASREIDPPGGFVQVQIAGLSEAMIIAHAMTMQGNLQAMDRLVKLTSELDHYHGFALARIPRGAGGGAAAAPKPRRSPTRSRQSRRFPHRDRGARGPDGKTESPGNGAATA